MLNKAGRPVGARIREALEILDRIGPARAVEVCAHMDNVQPSNAGKYCSRAVGLGLATVDRSGSWPVFAVAPSWRELAAARPEARRMLPDPVPARAPRTAFSLHGVWGAQA